MPLGHIGLNVPDLQLAKRYYDALLPLLKYEQFLSAADQFAYRPADGKRGTYLFFYPSASASTYSRVDAGLQHLAFIVDTRSEVDRVYRHVTACDGQVLHPPQHFPQYPPPYYATFWLDPFGFMLEAVCHHDRA
ncbi:extradiol dioxygenase [Skermania sp. ID1734]|uniref:VOC family protein n=1 Tax=Skermania sp. ID1734 TaxID=2597516 RepID=UPI0011807DEC|nr:VOC family protein [Skermania sp. ID1734]TSE02036.1 extradiol dioxygenase [Skermania sp. ID1734]